jgi:hypothetical protein
MSGDVPFAVVVVRINGFPFILPIALRALAQGSRNLKLPLDKPVPCVSRNLLLHAADQVKCFEKKGLHSFEFVVWFHLDEADEDKYLQCATKGGVGPEHCGEKVDGIGVKDGKRREGGKYTEFCKRSTRRRDDGQDFGGGIDAENEVELKRRKQASTAGQRKW